MNWKLQVLRCLIGVLDSELRVLFKHSRGAPQGFYPFGSQYSCTGQGTVRDVEAIHRHAAGKGSLRQRGTAMKIAKDLFRRSPRSELLMT